MRLLYDGWPLVYAPNSPAALHLLAMVECLPQAIDAHAALPGPAPDWLPSRLVVHVQPAADTPSARLAWVQGRLPQAAGRLRADWLHLAAPGAPLLGRVGCIASPCGFGEMPEADGWLVRLGQSLGYGGLARARAVLWPDDLPAPELDANLVRLPPLVHPAFWPDVLLETPEELDLPETFVLHHASPAHPAALAHLLQAWGWAAPALGGACPLLLAGLSQAQQTFLSGLAAGSPLASSLRPLPPLSPAALAAVYRRCAALFSPQPVTPWGEPVRHALASGRPVVACEEPLTAALVGPAAYLAPRADVRALGAALISVVGDESLADQLGVAARQRSSAWRDGFIDALKKIYALRNIGS